MMTFTEVWLDIPGEGWLSEDEARLLWDCTQRTQGAILEVGCYLGRSSVLLARSERPVFCVDPFDGFNEDYGGDRIEAMWRANMSDRGITNTTLFRMRVEDWTPQPVGLAYLDGDHTCNGTVRQIEVAQRCGATLIAVHDVNDEGAGFDVKRACLYALGKWTERVERLAIWRVGK